MPESWKYITDHIPAIIAGGMGGLVRSLTLKESVRDGLTSVVVGAITAVYAGPVATALMNPALKHIIEDETRRAAFGGFLIGCGGILVVGYFIDRWRAVGKKAKDKADA